MALTITEKILEQHCLQGNVIRGSIIQVSLDRIMVHESIALSIAKTIEKLGVRELKEPGKIVSFLDHWAPAPDENAAVMHQNCRSFVRHFNISHHHDVNGGVCHQVMIEKFVKPGEIVVGSDSHTPTYGALDCLGIGLGFTDVALAMAEGHTWLKVPEVMQIRLEGSLPEGVTGKDVILYALGELGTEGADYKAIEFSGTGVPDLAMDDRFTICNMSAEMGAKAAIMPVDQVTRDYMMQRGEPDFKEVYADEGAVYKSSFIIEMKNLCPMIAAPSSPANVHPIAEAAGTRIDQVFIGGCTNGRLSDLKQAAQILKGNKVASGVRLLVFPASYQVLRDAIQDGTINCLIDAGAVLGPPSCGPCFGAHQGLLGPGEKCFSSSNRNFAGRMGSKEAEIFLGSALSAAATAVAGKIIDPREFAKA